MEIILDNFDKKQIIFRPHPQDEFDYQKFGVEIENSRLPIAEIVYKFDGLISINSTSTIEAMCSGVPIFNFEIAPWSSCSVIQKGKIPKLEKFDYDQYIYDIARLVHLHYLGNLCYGEPITNSLKWYSNYDPKVFKFGCNLREEQPQIWKEEIRYNKDY